MKFLFQTLDETRMHSAIGKVHSELVEQAPSNETALQNNLANNLQRTVHSFKMENKINHHKIYSGNKY